MIQAVRGMNDVLPHETPCWQFLENIFQETFKSYGYQEIRFPIVEKTELFKRSIGEVTDIVEKEMYTFLDRNQEAMINVVPIFGRNLVNYGAQSIVNPSIYRIKRFRPFPQLLPRSWF